MKHAGHIAASHDAVKGKEENLCVLRNLKCHRGTAVVPAGEGLSEKLIFPHADQKRLISPDVFIYNNDASRKDDANVFHIFLLEGDDLAFAESGGVIGDAVQHGATVLLGDAFKERSV